MSLDDELRETPIGLNTRLEKTETVTGRPPWQKTTVDWKLIIEIKYPHGAKEVCREDYPGGINDGWKKRRWAKKRTKHYQDLYANGLLD